MLTDLGIVVGILLVLFMVSGLTSRWIDDYFRETDTKD